MSQEQESEDPKQPKYINYFESLLVEELALETDYLKLHYGKCAVAGRLTVASEKYHLENVRLKSLPKESSLPGGTVSVLLLGLDINKALPENLCSGCYCIVRGQVVLCSQLTPNSKRLQTLDVFKHVQGMSNETARQRYLENLRLTLTPAIEVLFVNAIDLCDHLIERKLQIKQLTFNESCH